MPAKTNKSVTLHRRLLNDIAEIQQEPYPNIHLYIDEANITEACLVLTPPDENPLHFVILFPDNYPLRAPDITIQSAVDHPNVFGEYICASILNTDEGWTPAYTLKGVLIQLLSFFSSDIIDQSYGGIYVNRNNYKERAKRRRQHNKIAAPGIDYDCSFCGFGGSWTPPNPSKGPQDLKETAILKDNTTEVTKHRSKLFELPDEVILALMDYMDIPDLASFSGAVPTIRHLVNLYDFIRIRELQCFCLKKSYLKTKLGIGVSISRHRRPVFRSEFDLLSNEAFNLLQVRKSVHGVEFERWLPLPLSRRHWNSVRQNVDHSLQKLLDAGEIRSSDKVTVLYHFMNTVVVQFSKDTDRSTNRRDARSTLTHASEKAVEAYFALFHLLLCIATEDPSVVTAANRMVARFLAGPRDKARFPDLGHLLVAALISDSGLTENLVFHIIKEAILRNVVWMLDGKGADMAELAYLEPVEISDYRLSMTYRASKTSYRLLMFLKLFSSAARKPGKSLQQLREELFDTHGAPPAGTSTMMAQRIRQIREIDCFPAFLTAMGIRQKPTKGQFSTYLKRTIGDSIAAGYSSMPMTQSQLYLIRERFEPDVVVSKEVEITPDLEKWFERGEKWFFNGHKRPSFFPNREDHGGRGGGRS